ncbi:uncharacterized protein [Panulirus ornatus]|uniref:uncharacterized protein isoform X2 n=1 Tax=Panulirus ornatus TaxID=150431 RepID=UPI003A8C46D2
MTATPLVILLLAVTGAIEGINGHYRGGPATTTVELKTVIVDANTVRTLLTTFTNFHTNTVTVQSVTTVTHYSTTYEVETRPVVITKNLQQDVIITSTQIATITSTLTTAGYY